MEKKEYTAPEMEVVKLQVNDSLLLEVSGENTEFDEPGGL